MIPVRIKDLILICSDGLNGVVKDADIQSVLVDNVLNLDQKTELLIKKAIEGGGPDNITVVLADVQDVEENSKNELTFKITTEEENEELLKEEDQLLKVFFKKEDKISKKRKMQPWIYIASFAFLCITALFVWKFGDLIGLQLSKDPVFIENYDSKGNDDLGSDSLLTTSRVNDKIVAEKTGKLILFSFDKELNENARVYIDGNYIGILNEIAQGGTKLIVGSHHYEVRFRNKVVVQKNVIISENENVEEMISF
jgi:hypothetical protein